ncbi:MAG TPA: nickel-dependent lactate racemase [Synergistales bacterium]|nr:nickel-dependent lactate racemase [Synergistales bacterium]
MEFKLAFGKGTLDLCIEDHRIADVLEPAVIPGGRSSGDIINEALARPMGTPPLVDIVRPGDRIAVVTSDITRPCPSRELLPPVLEELRLAGAREEDITVMFALGSHRQHTEEEKLKLVGDEIFHRFRCIDHDPLDCIHLGTTSRGTPVEIFRPVVEAERRICLGNIEFHYFAGYSGGAKAIFPGVSTRAAIQANHRMMLEDCARTGNLDGNPVREDLEEIGKFLPLDFILNVILDQQKQIVHAVAGHYLEAHRAGCTVLDTMGKVPINEQADVVVVSAGGYPKDMNVYQAQKALDNAVWAVRPGGVVIWVASCEEGLGSAVFQQWIESSSKPEDLIERVKSDFQLGGHKAAAIAMTLKKCSVLMVSSLDPATVSSFYVEPSPSIDKALDKAFSITGPSARVIVMPTGGSTLPVPDKTG